MTWMVVVEVELITVEVGYLNVSVRIVVDRGSHLVVDLDFSFVSF